MSRPRIAITGLGIVAPQGDEPAPVFEALCRGRSAVAFDAALNAVVAPVAFIDAGAGVRGRQAGVDRVSQFAIAAGASALADAGWSRDSSPWDVERSGIYVGTGFGGTTAIGEAVRRFHVDERIPPLSVVAGMANAAAAHLAIRTGFTGPVLTFSVACASSSIAIATGAKDIAHGEIDVALVGGAEAPLVGSMVASWQAMHTLASVRDGDAGASCRPFSASRTGLALGEGAAFLVLEDLDAARARGARIYAELAGSGTSCDAAHLTKPAVDGQVRAMRAALRQAGLAPRDIGYCNAHGTATIVGDEVETRSIGDLWGDDLCTLRVSSTKALHGHMLGAAGAIEALVTTLALHRRTVPPNAHCEDPDDACALPLVGALAEERPRLEAAITNSFAFGGTNSSLVLRRCDGIAAAGMRRRDFVAAAALGLTGCAAAPAGTSNDRRTTPTIDLHSHAGRVGPSRTGDFDRPFDAVAAPMRAGGMDVVCLAIVADTPVTRIEDGVIRAWREPRPGELHAWFVKAHDRARALIRREGLGVVTNAATLCAAIGHPSAIVASEGADFLEGRIERVDEAYDDFALRHLQLTHYRVNEIGDIQTVPEVHGGLTAFGRDVVRRCDARGIVVDVAHAPLATVRGVVDVATRPIVLSHTSLATTARPYGRTITPEHARLVAATGGVVGIWPPAARFPSLAALADGIRAMADVVGPAQVGLGTDMLGLTGRSIFDSYADLPALRDALDRAGFDADETAGIVGGNYARVFTAVVAAHTS